VFAAIVCLLGFVAGIIYTTRAGLYFLDIIDHFITNFSLVAVGILECIIIGWIFGAKRLREFFNTVSDFKIGVRQEIPEVLAHLVLHYSNAPLLRFPIEDEKL